MRVVWALEAAFPTGGLGGNGCGRYTVSYKPSYKILSNRGRGVHDPKAGVNLVIDQSCKARTASRDLPFPGIQRI